MNTYFFKRYIFPAVLVACIAFSSPAQNAANLAYSASFSHSGGGISFYGYGPENYNDSNICGGTSNCFGWVATGSNPDPNAWIEVNWGKDVKKFDQITIYVNDNTNRALSGATIQYWNGSAFVNHHSYNLSSLATLSYTVNFSTLVTNRIRLTNLYYIGSGNPATEEIEIRYSRLYKDDAGITAINSPVKHVSPGTHNVLASVMNMGSDTLKSAGLRWAIDGTMQTSPANWTGALANLVKANNQLLGSYNFTTGVRNIKAWTVNPNGQTDSNAYNDTIQSTIYVCNPVSGTYVVDAAGGGDFRSFNEALNWVSVCGMGGAVKIRVKPGNYTEQLTITNISGISKTNTLTLESYDLDSTSVNLNYAATSDLANWVVLLSGVKHVSIRNISIQATGTNYGCVLNIADMSDSNTIINNIIKTSTQNNTYFSGILFSSWVNGNTLDQYNIIRNNIITGGYLGIWMFGPDNVTMAKGNVIERNIIRDFYYYGMYMVYQDSLRVHANTVENSSTSTSALGIYSLYSNKLNISHNTVRLYGSSNLYGIYNYYSNSGTSLPYTNIYNNFVSLGTSSGSQCIGMYNYYSGFINYTFNTVNIYNSSTSSYNMYFYRGINLTFNLFNNILVNNSGGYAIYMNSTGLLNSSDYNDLYTTGTNLAYLSTNLTNLAAWKSATGMDKNSISGNVQFYSMKDLHLNTSVVNNLGQTVSGITNDIDYENRSATPDIGADEFNLLSDDAGVSDINSPQSPCPGSNTVSVKVKNYGTSTLTGITVNWKVNGVGQTAVATTVSLSQYQEAVVTLGSYVFNSGSVYKLKFWTSQPNSTSDPNPRNDTFSYVISRTAMYGTYTIGAVSSDYKTFKEAVDDLMLRGVCNHVLFRVKAGSYNENVNIPSILGASAASTITFESYDLDSNSADLYYASSNANNNYVVGLYGADYITFRHLKIQATGINYGRAVYINGSANYCSFTNNIISSQPGASSSNFSGIYSDGTKDDYTLIKNNRITGGYYGIYLYGVSTSSRELNSVITGNVVSDFYYYGIAVYYNSSTIISNNYIEPSAGAASNVYGIYCYYNNDSLTITKNKILLNCPATNYGMYLYYCQSTASVNSLVANNFVALNGVTTATNYGLYEYYCNYMNTYNNSIQISNKSSANSYAFYCNNGSGLKVANNIFSNQGGGYAFYVSSTASLASTNYNNLYTTGTNMGYWNGNRANLAAWKTAASPNESNSINANPYFYSNNDLHVYSKLLDSAATSIGIIRDDIDNDQRNATRPDIGADEFRVWNTDAAVVALVSPVSPCPGTKNNISVRLRNYGLDKITSTKVKWSLNGTMQTPYNFSGSLATLKDTVLVLGSDTFYKGVNYNIKAWTDTVNGAPDQNKNNDSLIIQNFHTALSGSYTIGSSGRDYPNFTAAVNELTNSGICDQVVFLVDPGTYNEHISIPPVNGASASKTITFKSANGDSTSVTLAYNAAGNGDNYVVLLNGADYIRFENMTLKAGSLNGYGCVVELRNAANYNIFRNNVMVYTGSASGSAYGVYSSNSFSTCNYNLIDNNSIQNGYYGIYLYGSSTTTKGKGNKIRNNQITNFYYFGMNLYYHDSMDVYRNKLTGGTNAAYGIYNYYNSNSVLSSNQVYLNSSNAMYGFYLYNCTGTSTASFMLTNNMVSIFGTSTQNAFGIYSSYCNYNKYHHNTIHISCGSQTAGGGIYFNSPATGTYGNIEVQNNIIVNTGGGYAMNVAAGAVTRGYISKSNFNDLFVTGNYIGRYGTVDVPQLKNWQAIPLDQKSFSTLPAFVSSYNLHLSSHYGMWVQNSVNVQKDIDEETRSTSKPVVGADENPHLPIDAGIRSINSPAKVSCDGIMPVSAYLVNFGLNKLDSVYIDYYLDGVWQRTIQYKGSLAYLNNTTISFGNDTFTAGSNPFRIKIKTRLPNGSTADTFTFNDADSVDVRFTPFPLISSVSGDTVCKGDSATLQVFSSNTRLFSWYDSAVNGKLLSTDSIYYTPVLSKTITYYVEANSGGNPATITTTNSTSAAPEMGNMFDIKASSSDVVIDSFAIHLTSATLGQLVPVEVYYKAGTYAGYETNASAWTLLGIDTVLSNGYLALTDISTGGVKIAKNQTYGFYVTTTDPNYVLHNTSGQKTFSDPYLQITTGTKTYYPFDATYQPNTTWNGMIYYNTGSMCRSNRMPVVAKVYDIPNVKLGTDRAFCKGGSVLLDAGYGDNFAYDWQFGGSNTTISASQTITVDSAGSYRVIVTNNCGNTSTDTIQVTVWPVPDAAFSINKTEQCLSGNSFSFSNQSTLSSGTFSSFKWYFGDGQTDSNTHAVHSYSIADTYQVKLRAVSQFGCIDTVFANVMVYPQPKAIMGIDKTNQCLSGNIFNFSNNSTISNGSIAAQNWDFGDMVNSSLQNPSHIYLADDTFNVKLVVITDKNCSDSVTKTVIVYPQPKAGFTINDSSQCFKGHHFTFKNNSSIKSGTLSYAWNMGDANTFTTTDAAHDYAAEGNYSVMLKSTSALGCRDSLVKMAYVKPHPVVNLGNDTTIKGNQSLTLNAGSSLDSVRWSTKATTNTIIVDSAGLGLGIKTISVAVYKEGCASYDTIVVTIKSSVGIDVINGGFSLSVYPNPVDEMLQIVLKTNSRMADASITDMPGKQVWRSVLVNDHGLMQMQVDMSKFSKGTYLLKVVCDGKATVVKVVKN